MVVLVPGLGDDVQALKAGIMEIADVFVINKADQLGADRVERELQAMLSLLPASRRRLCARLRPKVPASRNCRGASRAQAKAGGAPDDGALHRPPRHRGARARPRHCVLPGAGTRRGARETIAGEKVHVAMLPAGDSRIELLEPSAPDSPIAKFLEKRGPGLHHVALRVPDLNAAVARLARLRRADAECAARRGGRPHLRFRPPGFGRRRTAGTYSIGGLALKAEIGIIGGSGLYSMPGFEAQEEANIDTPFGAPSDNYVVGRWRAARWPFWPATDAAIASPPRS